MEKVEDDLASLISVEDGFNVLTVKQVAMMLHLHCNTVRRKASLGHIPGSKIGNGPWRFRAEAIENLVPRRGQRKDGQRKGDQR